jgi:ABC-type nitrate/sulfonate/bicarbonate transport system ATPase subunit
MGQPAEAMPIEAAQPRVSAAVVPLPRRKAPPLKAARDVAGTVLRAVLPPLVVVLLVDKPFGALDALTRAHLQDSLMEIHATLGNTVVMITHDVDEAGLLSDRVVMMTNGPAVTIGSILDVPLPRPHRRMALVGTATCVHARAEVLRFLDERKRRPEAA